MTYLLLLIPVALIVASCFELYRFTRVTVAYTDNIGQLRGYAFDYVHRANEQWLDIQEWEQYVAAKKNMPIVKIVKIKIDTSWKLRRALNTGNS